MAKATKQVSTKTKARKPAKKGKRGKAKTAALRAGAASVKRGTPLASSAGPLKLSPLGRRLCAARYERGVLTYIGPGITGALSEEIECDERYARAHKKAHDAAYRRELQIEREIMSKPATLASLADRALVANDHLDSHEELNQVVDALIALTGDQAEFDTPWDDWRVGHPPPEAEAIIRKLLGKRRPKRFALPRDEADRIASAAAAEALAKAAAAIKAKPGDAPLFAEAA